MRPYCTGGHIAKVVILHRWPYCIGGHIAQVVVLHRRPIEYVAASTAGVTFAGRPGLPTERHLFPSGHEMLGVYPNYVWRHKIYFWR